MARIRIFIVLALALVAGGTFAFGTYQYMQAAPAAATTGGVKTVAVLVAASDMDLGAEVRREDLRAIQWPADAVPMGAFSNPDELVGRGLIQPVTQNEVFLPAKLASKEAGAGLPPIIPEGYRALSVRVNDVVGVAGYVLPGTRVDVVATVNPTQRPEDVQTKVILTNVQVLTAGTKIERDEADGKPLAVSVVTLLVDPGPGRAPDAGEHRGQDSARAAQPHRQDRAVDRRHPPGRADGGRQLRPGRASGAAVGDGRGGQAPAMRRAPRPVAAQRPSRSSAATSARRKS